MEAFYGILITFLGTSLGAACVFFLKKTLSDAVQRALTGFAAGVMVAASVWSLLIPAIAQSAALGRWSFLPAALGFWAGILFLLALDHIIPHLRCGRAGHYARTSGRGVFSAGVAAAELHLYWAYDVVGRFALAAHCPGAGAAVSGGDGGAVRILAVHPHRQMLLCRHACRHPVSLVQE